MPANTADAILRSLLDRRIKQTFLVLTTELLVRKTAAEGVRMSARQKAAFHRWLKSGSAKSFSMRFPRKVAIHISSRDIRRLLGKLRFQSERDAASGAKAVIATAPKILRKEFNRTWPAYQRDYDRGIRAFEQRLAGRYETPFRLLALLNTLARDLGEQVNDAARRAHKPGKHYRLVEALTRLHARACQIAREVEALLRKGYADGAMARWRSLHEVNATLQFITIHGAATADRYLDHEIFESLSAARGYNEMSKRLDHEPFTAAEMTQMEDALAAMKKKHDENFNGRYGWAAKALKNPKPNFAHIEKAVGLDHFRPYYKLASHNVHANPKGILFRMGVLQNTALLPTGPSNVGLTDPAQNAALSLAQATAAVVRLAPSLERWAHVAVLNDLAPEIGREFWKVEQRIAADEWRIQKGRGTTVDPVGDTLSDARA